MTTLKLSQNFNIIQRNIMSNFTALTAPIFSVFKQVDISLGTAGVGGCFTGNRVLCKRLQLHRLRL